METRPVIRGALALLEPAALVLGAGQVVAPGAVVGAPHLGVDEAVDALMADGDGGLLLLEPAGDLLGRPTALEAIEHQLAQLCIVLQA